MAEEATDLDHQGAVIWIDCPLCLVDRNIACVSIFMLGQDLIAVMLDPGKVHDARMRKWLEFKARVVAGAGWTRRPNMQQVPRTPRSEPHRISEGGTEEDRVYWENRNKLKAIRRHAKPIVFHESFCTHPKTATCICGKEPFYSPEARKKRGEIT